jgi:hypothetical protein
MSASVQMSQCLVSRASSLREMCSVTIFPKRGNFIGARGKSSG